MQFKSSCCFRSHTNNSRFINLCSGNYIFAQTYAPGQTEEDGLISGVVKENNPHWGISLSISKMVQNESRHNRQADYPSQFYVRV